jgi:Glycosyltransferase sugar-binding region containing DXD motif
MAPMSLSICLVVADPPARVAAVLEPLRPLADEILIAADSRVDATTLSGYGALADRLFSIEFVSVERHLSWLFSQCRCDWILRLDGDEVPSRALVRQLPRMLSSASIQQFWINRRWLYPDGEHVVSEAPWNEDFSCRLTRNGGTLRATGQQHTSVEPVTPLAYVEEPLYHLELVTTSVSERRDKVVRYEVARPRLLSPGGGRLNEGYYLPELRCSPSLAAVPAEDRPLLALALEHTAAPTMATAPAVDAPLVSLSEMDRMWEGAAVASDAYRARIEARDPSPTLAPGEHRQLFVTVSNDGSARWPATLDANPPIRLSYHWLHTDGSVHTQDGLRSAFGRVVGPGERILAPLNLDAPPEPGEYLLEIDLVHEHVRWFECGCRVPVRVEQPRDLLAVGPRLSETPPPARQRWRRTRIPHTIHRVWLGDAPMPQEHERFGGTFAHHHRNWEMRLWVDADLATLDIGLAERERSRTHSELSNLVRYEILRRHGGVYVDTDVECRRALTPLLKGVDAFAALELPGRVGTAVLGSIPGHPAFSRAARLARQTLGTGPQSTVANGPYLLSLILEQEPGVAILEAGCFYPYLWDEPDRRHDHFPGAYAVHHWAQSWATYYA